MKQVLSDEDRLKSIVVTYIKQIKKPVLFQAEEMIIAMKNCSEQKSAHPVKTVFRFLIQLRIASK